MKNSVMNLYRAGVAEGILWALANPAELAAIGRGGDDGRDRFVNLVDRMEVLYLSMPSAAARRSAVASIRTGESEEAN